MPKNRAHVIVEGRVQGVCFRAETQYEARILGVNGWVRNLRSGGVEAVFEGEQDSVRGIIEWCHNGPPRAIVKDVTITWDEYKGEYDGFSIKF